jgi:hypothetical protein
MTLVCASGFLALHSLLLTLLRALELPRSWAMHTLINARRSDTPK